MYLFITYGLKILLVMKSDVLHLENSVQLILKLDTYTTEYLHSYVKNNYLLMVNIRRVHCQKI